MDEQEKCKVCGGNVTMICYRGLGICCQNCEDRKAKAEQDGKELAF